MVWEVIFCTGARVGDDSGYSIPDCRRAAVRELAGRTVLPKLARRRVFVDGSADSADAVAPSQNAQKFTSLQFFRQPAGRRGVLRAQYYKNLLALLPG
jgi:hypothetical protein